jgi:hypothetical protein
MRKARGPWGDYGSILMHGMTAHLPRDSNGSLQLERTGPHIPPISFPFAIIFTDAAMNKLEGSGLSGFSFKAVKLARIVRLDWHLWDINAKEPKHYPSADGEPEGYILDRKDSTELALKMGPLWELILQPGATEVRIRNEMHSWKDDIFIESGSLKGLDFFRADTTRYCYASERAKEWMEKQFGEYVSFEPCRFKAKPRQEH